MLDRRGHTESCSAASLDIDGVQKFVKHVGEERDLSFTVDGDVRLDACVPARLDASPGRLLEAACTKSERLARRQLIDVFNELKI